MSHQSTENSGGPKAMVSPFRLLRILSGYTRPYSSRAVCLLLTDTPTTASVVTLTPSIFIILQREQLLKLMQQHAGLGAQVREALARRLTETDAMTA